MFDIKAAYDHNLSIRTGRA